MVCLAFLFFCVFVYIVVVCFLFPWGLYSSISAANLLQLWQTLCNPMGCSPPGSSVWDSPGKNTGMGCCALFNSIYMVYMIVLSFWSLNFRCSYYLLHLYSSWLQVLVLYLLLDCFLFFLFICFYQWASHLRLSCFLVVTPFSPSKRSSFIISFKAGLVVLNFISICLSVKLFISPSNLNEDLAE